MKNRLGYNEISAKIEMQRHSGFQENGGERKDHFGKKMTKSGRSYRKLVSAVSPKLTSRFSLFVRDSLL